MPKTICTISLIVVLLASNVSCRQQDGPSELARTISEVPSSTNNEERDEPIFFDGETSTKTIPGGYLGIDSDDAIRMMNLHIADEDRLVELIDSAPSATSINLEFSIIEESAVKIVCRCRELEEIFLGMPEDFGQSGLFTNNSLEMLSKLPKLRVVHIRSRKIDDRGIPHLAKLRHLEELNLRGCDLTDASIDSFAKLDKLCYLNVSNTKISDDAISKLRKLNPSLRIDNF